MLNKEICRKCFTKRYGHMQDFHGFEGHLYFFDKAWNNEKICYCAWDVIRTTTDNIPIESEIPEGCHFKLEQMMLRDDI